MEDVDDVAAAFLAALGPMEAVKLHKLVYYAQAWSAARGRGALFSNPIQAWAQGPVVPWLYRQQRGLYSIGRWPHGNAARLSDEARDIVAWVVGQYGERSAADLSDLTHAETPWVAARDDLPDGVAGQTVISVAAMAAFYGRQVLSADDAVRHAVGNAALEGLEVPADVIDTLGKVARGERTADDVVAELVSSIASRA